MQVQRQDGNVWPSTYSIDWDAGGAINDVAQVVDGKWKLEAGGVRAVEPDYDRLISLGDVNWTDYEVTFPVTFNALDTSGFSRLGQWRGGPWVADAMERAHRPTDRQLAAEDRLAARTVRSDGTGGQARPMSTWKLEGNNRLLASRLNRPPVTRLDDLVQDAGGDPTRRQPLLPIEDLAGRHHRADGVESRRVRLLHRSRQRLVATARPPRRCHLR